MASPHVESYLPLSPSPSIAVVLPAFSPPATPLTLAPVVRASHLASSRPAPYHAFRLRNQDPPYIA